LLAAAVDAFQLHDASTTAATAATVDYFHNLKFNI